MSRNSRWAKEIISLQDEDGKWGYFHTLFGNSESLYTTEKALRRLEILGYTIEDDCIKKAVFYMNDCLTGIKEIPDRREKLCDWNTFTSLMLAAWIRRFTKDNPAANAVAEKLAKIVTIAFEDGAYNHQKYLLAYCDTLGTKPKGGRLIDFVQFYTVSIINGYLDSETERRVLEYIINKPDGIYYTYDKCIRTLPDAFEGKYASWYLGSIELLAEYQTAKQHLQFVVDWIEENRNAHNQWDLGKNAKDGVYFPLSDNWRKAETRERDCTERISKLLSKLTT